MPNLEKAGMLGNFKVELIYKNKLFGPDLIDEVSKEYKVSKSRILIGSIHEHHPFDYADLGGVRIIF